MGGPTGVGKTSVIAELVASYPDRYIRPLAYSTRGRRNETDLEYQQLDKAKIAQLYAKREVLNYDEVYGEVYAIDRRSVEAALAEGRCPIKEVHPSRFEALAADFPRVTTVLVLPLDAAAPETLGLDSRRRQRRPSDDAFYRSFDPLSTDILRYVNYGIDRADLALELHLSLEALHESADDFPSPREIDARNHAGYTVVAPEFSDERRPTTRAFHQISRDFWESVVNGLPAGARVLELGPGNGWLRQDLSWPAVNYESVELCPAMARAKEGTGSARALAVKSGTIDFVVASLADPFLYPVAAVEISRILVPGGRFLGTAPAAEWSDLVRPQSEANVTSFDLDSRGDRAEVFSFTYTGEGLRSMLARRGFQTVQVEAITASRLIEGGMALPPLIAAALSRASVPARQLPLLWAFDARKGATT